MKVLSVKGKMTLWLTLLMALLAGLLLVFLLVISRAVATGTAMEQLTQTVRSNLTHAAVAEGKPQLDEGFSFYQNGVSTLVYSQSGSLLAGQLPVSFTTGEPFQNGLTRTVDTGRSQFLVLDVWLPENWDSGIWVRGLMEAPDNRALTVNLTRLALVALPVFLLLAALGSHRIAKHSFRPLEDITATAEAINEARDLSGRIGLPPGRDEFSRLGAAFDHMFERLERSFEAEKRFTADASHELRTPVSIIKGACEYAEKYDETPEDHQETVAMIHRQADKMANLISQLLSMTRMEQETEQVPLIPLDLAEVVRSLCQEAGWQDQGLGLEVQGPAPVLGSRQLLERLIRNLVENAFKYGSPQGPVWVSVVTTHTLALLSVRDQGQGIPKEEQEKIWQRFYQVDPARSGEEGAGLGLAMVEQIARLHGGSMTLESSPGQGSTFTLRLPLTTPLK